MEVSIQKAGDEPFFGWRGLGLEKLEGGGGVMAGVWCVLWCLGWLWHDGKPHSD